MPSAQDIVTFDDAPPPPGMTPWVVPGEVGSDVAVVAYDSGWTDAFEQVARRVRAALGLRVLALEHVGSTSVPGLSAKPIIDVDLVVADPDDESAYVPALAAEGFELRVREPWWYRHRMLRSAHPRANLHVFGPESPEPVRHTLFRDWLRASADDRALYAEAKAESARATKELGEGVEEYNARKQRVIREIYRRAFAAAGLQPAPPGL